jgi:CRISPR-associated protein Cas2
MALSEDRFMMLLIFFDLPTDTKKARREYGNFRRYLLKNGFMMLQFSVYVRVCKGQENIKNQLNKLKFALPSHGNIRALQITNNQYNAMEILLGTIKPEEAIANNQLILL